MKQQANFGSARQQGIALPIVMVIFVLAAMIVLYMANTSRKEQQISADQYRTEQSQNAAMAAHDWAIDYYNSVGLTDVDGNDVLDLYVPDADGDDEKALNVEDKADSSGSGASNLVLTAKAFYCSVDEATFWTDPENCNVAPDIGAKHVGVVSIGYSDDNTARRVITVVLAGAPLSGDDGPGQPLTTKGEIGFTGSMTIINRYFNVNIMSGGPTVLSSSASATVVGGDEVPLGVDRFDESIITREDMTDTDIDDKDGKIHSLLGSTNTRGNNADVIENVSELANLSTDPDDDEFFQYFLDADKEAVIAAAEGIGQYYETCDKFDAADPPPTSGVIWIKGDCATENFGTEEEPAAVFIEGDLEFGGNDTLYGLLYVTGDLTITGGPTVKGSIIVEGSFPTDKAGDLTLVYDPLAITPSGGFLGRRSIVPGTWKDWESN